MCYYITATLPKDTDIESMKNILDRYNMAFSPLINSFITFAVIPTYIIVAIIFLITISPISKGLDILHKRTGIPGL